MRHHTWIDKWLVAKFESNKRVMSEYELTENSIANRIANFPFSFHINFNCHQHRMDIELKGNHAINFQ